MVFHKKRMLKRNDQVVCFTLNVFTNIIKDKEKKKKKLDLRGCAMKLSPMRRLLGMYLKPHIG